MIVTMTIERSLRLQTPCIALLNPDRDRDGDHDRNRDRDRDRDRDEPILVR
jgi:hypothetical protein